MLLFNVNLLSSLKKVVLISKCILAQPFLKVFLFSLCNFKYICEQFASL